MFIIIGFYIPNCAALMGGQLGYGFLVGRLPAFNSCNSNGLEFHLHRILINDAISHLHEEKIKYSYLFTFVMQNSLEIQKIYLKRI